MKKRYITKDNLPIPSSTLSIVVTLSLEYKSTYENLVLLCWTPTILEMIKINSLNENYQSYDSVVIAGGNNGKSDEGQYENIDKILIETLKDKEKNIVGVQQSNTKFSYVDLYSNDKVYFLCLYLTYLLLLLSFFH